MLVTHSTLFQVSQLFPVYGIMVRPSWFSDPVCLSLSLRYCLCGHQYLCCLAQASWPLSFNSCMTLIYLQSFNYYQLSWCTFLHQVQMSSSVTAPPMALWPKDVWCLLVPNSKQEASAQKILLMDASELKKFHVSSVDMCASYSLSNVSLGLWMIGFMGNTLYSMKMLHYWVAWTVKDVPWSERSLMEHPNITTWTYQG